jgi:alpha-tubulin suppressor-like RCC1 family protein
MFYSYQNEKFIYISWPPNRAEEIQKQQKQNQKSQVGGDPFTDFLQQKIAGKIFRCLVRYAEGKHFERVKEQANRRYMRNPEGQHRLFTWGVGLSGRLGHGYGLAYATPHEVTTFPSKAKVVEVACGCEHTIVRTFDGAVLTWGNGDRGQLGTTENYQGVGVNTAVTPQAVQALKRYLIVSIASGRWHNIVLTSDRMTWVWGANDFGQLGIDSFDTKGTPVQLKALEGRAPCKALCGGWHSSVVTETGKMLLWGKNTHGQLGFGDTRTVNYPRINTKLRSIGKVRTAALGANHTLVVLVANRVFSFGQGESGQLGHDRKDNSWYPEEVQSLHQKNVCEVAAGDQHSLALSVFGEVWAWGGSPFGQLGHGGMCS